MPSTLGYPIGIKNTHLVEDLPMIIPGQFGFNYPSGFREEAFMVLYHLMIFCSDMKFKMAATAGLSLTLDPMGKMFQNASSLKPLGQLKPNCIYVLRWRPSWISDRHKKQ
jgi:hypothetical protein